MRRYIGTSGFGYEEWRGKFYPKDLPAEKRLEYYAERFNATEVNSTFYRLPAPSVVRGWERRVPKGFSLSYKAPASITHMLRLKNAGKELERFLKLIGPGYGVVNFQLPPGFKKDFARLQEFAALLPKGRFSFEFRNPSWFDDEVIAFLKKRKLALCYNDADVKGCPIVDTAPFQMLKLRKVVYAKGELEKTLRKIGKKPLFLFFKHEKTASGPKLAQKAQAFLDAPPYP